LDLKKNEGFLEKPQEETKKSFIPISIVLILLVLIGMLFFAAAYFREKKDFVFYLSEGSLYCSDRKGEPRLISDQMGAVLGENVQAFVSRDKKLLYREGEEESGTLYLLDLDRSADPVPVAEKVGRFFVSEDFSAVLYTRGKDLYRWDFEKEELLYSHWEGEGPKRISSRFLVWQGQEDQSYAVGFHGEVMALGEGVEDVLSSRNGELLYYLRENSLWRQGPKEKEEAVASCVGALLAPWGEKGVLYLWREEQRIPLSSFVTDDFLEYDRQV